MIGNPGFHRGSDAQRLVNSTEVVPREVESNRSFQVVQFFRVGIRKPSKTTQVHTQTQIGAFHVRRADVLRVRPSVADFGYNLRDVSWGVSLIPVLTIVSVQLHKLREVRLSSEHILHSTLIEVEAIGSELEAIFAQSSSEASEESQRGFLRALADLETRHQLGLRVESDEDPRISNFGRIIIANVTRLLSHEAPYLVTLQVSRTKVADTPKGAFGIRRCRKHQRENRPLVQTRQPRDGANAHPFKHHGKGLRYPRRIGVVCANGFGSMGIGEGCATGIAAPALNFSLAVGAELLTGLVFASGAGHGVSPLAFCEETSQNNLGSEAWVTPRFGLAPTPASTEAGALSQLLSYWWRPRHRFLPRFLKRRLSRGVSHLLPRSFLRATAQQRAKLLIDSFGVVLRDAVSGLAALKRFTLYFVGRHSFQSGRYRSEAMCAGCSESETDRLQVAANFGRRQPLPDLVVESHQNRAFESIFVFPPDSRNGTGNFSFLRVREGVVGRVYHRHELGKVDVEFLLPSHHVAVALNKLQESL